MGLAGQAPFHAVDPANAGWRYGFVAVTTDGKRVYGETNRGVNGKNATVAFTVPQKNTVPLAGGYRSAGEAYRSL